MSKFPYTFLFLLASIDIGFAHYDKIEPVVDYREEFVIERLTVYNPTSGQTDSTPLITASNAVIDTVKLRKGKLRWLALSRDFLTRWGGKINYGDTIEILSDDSDIKGLWIVHDTMNKRYKKSGDILTYNRKKGLWKNIKFKKI
ncbi:MAG: hypothetical protein VKL60_14905 [Sphaerospermopsis sp.]|nr:hypothetical protein [Sphaerospermopsis sp.]